MLSMMQPIVVIFGVLICMASTAGFIAPEWLLRNVRHAWQNRQAMTLAVLTRVFLGLALILTAPGTLYPGALRVIGSLGLVAAIGLPVIGWTRIDNLLAWFQRRPAWLMRLWTLFGVVAGGFIAMAAATHQ